MGSSGDVCVRQVSDPCPLYPAPVVRLRVRRPPKVLKPNSPSRSSSRKRKPTSARGKSLSSKLKDDAVDADPDYMVPTVTHRLFCFAVLVGESSDHEHVHQEGSKTRHIIGSVVSSLYHLRGQGCFVFPELCVRTEGRWRLKISMFEFAG